MLSDRAPRAVALQGQLRRYADLFEAERSAAQAVIAFLESEPHPFRRATPGAHITASAFVVDLNAHALLLIHHRSLNRWLQPGGHVDEAEEPLAAAIRETEEETGLRNLAPPPWPDLEAALPLDIDSHLIPANLGKSEAAHIHHDVRFLLKGSISAPLAPALSEVEGARWAPFHELDALFPARIRRKLERLAAR